VGQKGKLKNVFPGGNTGLGFYSYYHYMYEFDATKVYVIKGGPGVGKSTLMRSVGEVFLEKGYDVEYHWCSSDNGSLDGVVIPELGIAMLDGTAPHVVDPKNPGAVDTIVHLGDYWNEDIIRKSKEDILTTNKRVGRTFQTAYHSLKQAKVVLEEWQGYVTESMDFTKVNQLTDQIRNELFVQVTPQYAVQPKIRKLYATAITPKGYVNHYESILQDVTNLICIKGQPGTGRSTLIAKIAERATELGLDTEIYHCPMDPLTPDGVLIPDLKAAVVNISKPLQFNVNSISGLDSSKTIDLDSYADKAVLNGYQQQIAETQDRFWSSFNRAISYIAKAKAAHDELETFYVPAMDFGAINERKERLIKEILSFT